MDLSTLISPLLNLASVVVKSYNNGPGDATKGGKPNASTMAALDRTLGTVATLGLAFGLFRVLKHLRDEYGEVGDGDSESSNRDRGRIARSIKSLVHVLLRKVMMGLGIKRIEAMPTNGGDRNRDGSQQAKRMPIRTFSGSCHCKSISFILRAPSHIEARECHGKIKYPHCLSNADDFQLITGTQLLSVYYVELSDDTGCNASSNSNTQPFDNSIIAAHTFCSRCGVHILRAPNSYTNKLEVNTSCLDDFDGNNDKNLHNFMSINVTIDENKNGMGMGGGKPVEDNFKRPRKHQFQDRRVDDDFRSNSMSNSTARSHISRTSTAKQATLPWPVQTTVYEEEDYESNLKWRLSDSMSQASTPATMTSTLIPGSIISSSSDSGSSSDVDGDGLSYDENSVGSPPLNTGFTPREDDSISISGWPVASSLQTPRHHEMTTASTTSSTASKNRSRPSSLMKDQLKYYMSKHIASPPSRLQEKDAL
jgi:hypothetical protein